MSGIELSIDVSGIDRAQTALDALGGIIPDLMISIGAVVESQTRRRISEEKTSPDGEPWELRSPGYAQSLRPGGGILVREGGLLDSIAFVGAGNEVSVGTDLIYGAIHQFGGTSDMAPGPAGIPARPFLGLSGDNELEILDLVNLAVSEVLQ